MIFRSFIAITAASILASGATVAQAEEVWLECDSRLTNGYEGIS